MNILIGFTGSVATVLCEKIISEFQKLGEVRVIITESARHFITSDMYSSSYPVKIYRDKDEWEWKIEPPPVQMGRFSVPTIRLKYEKGDEVLHIELRKWADVFVIAPCSANTLAKLANGICDNLLTSVARCWDFNKHFIIAPSMNTFMLEHPSTKIHTDTLTKWGVKVVDPQSKKLACGDVGSGAMAEISTIIDVIKSEVNWIFPVESNAIPIGNHPGAFGFTRKHDIHSGVDLYCTSNATVYAVEAGEIIKIGPFTGPSAGFPWWLDTKCIAIEGLSGVVNYGEITPNYNLKVGDKVKRGQYIGNVIPVLREGKERSDIPGHSRYMLHLELYKKGTKDVWRGWQLTDPKQPDELLDPTEHLRKAGQAPQKILTM